jgi:glutamyl-tRNA reductase
LLIHAVLVLARQLFMWVGVLAPAETIRTVDALQVVGASHHGAPLEVREAIARAVADRPATLRAIAALPGVRGVVLLSTCNRVEAYVDGVAHAMPAVVAALGGSAHAPHLLQASGAEALLHAFRVAAGLDSMALGDAQILGQWKDACRQAAEAGTLSPLLARLHDRAVSAAREARTRTDVGRRAVSLSHVAVELVQRVYGDLDKRRVLVVGTGKMAALAARRLVECGAAATVVAGRQYDHAAKLAAELGVPAVPAAELGAALAAHDVIVSATSCPHAVITRSMVEAAKAARRGQPLLLVDLAVPRDVEAAVRDVPGVFLYDVDGLRGVAEANRRLREKEAVEAERIVARAVSAFETEHGGAAAAIVSLRKRAEEIRQAELEKARKRLGELTPEQAEALEATTRAIVNRVLHVPTTQLRLLGQPGNEADLELARALLGVG